MSTELKCCELCEAYSACERKGECCPECSHFDPLEHVCTATHKPKPSDTEEVGSTAYNDDTDIDETTFLFDDEEEEDFEPEDDEPDFEDIWD